VSAPPGGRISWAYSRAVVFLRAPVIVLWIAAAVAATLFLPGLSNSSTAPIGDIVPEHAKATAAEQRAFELFKSVSTTDSAIVQRNPKGLSQREVQGTAQAAAAVDRRQVPPDLRGVSFAVPLVNVTVPGTQWGEHNTTAITYLFLNQDLNLSERLDAANAYLKHLPAPEPGATAAVTGAGPARIAQFNAIDDALPWITIATVLLIAAIVGVAFRSILAPLITLGTAVIAYLCAVHVMSWLGGQFGQRPPSEIQPVLVVLLLGLVTDYTVFFMSECRRRLNCGDERLPAAREATARIVPIVLVAGALVTAGAASLLAGRMTFFQVFGPGLAICALVVTIVCVSLVPAVLGLLGPRMFGSRGRAEGPAREPSRLRRSLARWLTARPVAIVIGLACIAALAFGAAGARSAHLGVSFIPSLPKTNLVRKAADAAGHAFVPGILAPTDVVLEQRGVGDDRAALARLQSLIARQPGVATVLGPGLPLPPSAVPFLIARTGDAARFITILNHEPTTSEAIATLRRLQDRMPSLLGQAGLPAGTRVSYGGETALSSETVHQLVGDLWRVGIVTAVVMFLLLAVFLRALLAPILLLAGAVLAFAGAFGLTALLLPPTVGGHEFVYYVPLVAAVLLVGLGSDYNVFIVGRIHEEARHRSLRASIAAAVPSAARAVTIAGLTMAASFALLAIVPLRPFRELAMLMTIGVLLDALFVRPVLVPAMIAAVGPKAWWPSRPDVDTPETARELKAEIAEALAPETEEPAPAETTPSGARPD
jgi:RND superfamily putative drug exporter